MLRKIVRKAMNFFRPTQKETKFKKQLTIKKDNHMLSIIGQLDGVYRAKELYMAPSPDDTMIKLADIQPSTHFKFDVDLQRYEEEYTPTRYGFYLLVQVSQEQVSPNRYEALKKNATAKEVALADGGFALEYLVRLGKFDKTNFDAYEKFNFQHKSGYVYINSKGFISLVIDLPVNVKPKATIDKIKSTDGHFYVSGKIVSTSSKIVEAQILLTGRETGEKYRVPAKLEAHPEKSKSSSGYCYYNFEKDLDLKTVGDGKPLKEDIYDFYLEYQLINQEENMTVRLGAPRFFVKKYSKVAHLVDGDSVFTVSPYFTIKYFNLSFQVEKYERETYTYLTKMMKWAWLLRPLNKKRDIWLVGERSYKAQDTGYHFFKYMRTEHPERNVYYVIDKDSPELENIKDLGNILFQGSKEHIWHTLMATRVIGSHHPDYLYPIRTEKFKKAVKAKKVFLQHGVMGTKNMVYNYGVMSKSFETDLFIVSSDYEKRYIVQDFGYEPSMVSVTGLSRFDSLLKNDVKIKRQILIIPTWRDWIVNDEQFKESEYFARYRELVFHPLMHEYANKYHFEIVLCLHPNMQRFTSFFSDAPVKIVNQGDIDVQYLLKESAMMITDYSSVGFDMSFLTKPIIYYQFDRSRFIGKYPSHLDLDNDLPGEIVDQVEDILEFVESYAADNFRMKPEYQKRASKFIKYRDLNSCKRIYQAILQMPAFKKQSIKSMVRNSEFLQKVFGRFRKSKYYFPTMKAFYNVARRILPVDDKLIVFESGVGKQYSDSPRYIYEEIVRRKLPYKKVWVYDKAMKFQDPNTIKVQRLSFKYYYYLAKARYWVNNQNFPTYIKKRPQTTYLQTWHGTPLKKMLFDMESVQGRSDDYVERVYGATKTWDYLVSPSPYATEAFKSAFHYEGSILEMGYPRNDLFYRKDNIRVAYKTRKALKIPPTKKVILYAPTFRDNQTKGGANKFSFDIQMDLEQMKKALGDEYVLLLRMHVVIKNKITIPQEYKDFVMDVSTYPDIQELYLISDILITDYSSVMFDFANSKKPILFFTYDLEFYRDELRGFYFDLENEAPGPMLKTTDEIIRTVQNIEQVQKDYNDKYNHFYSKFCKLEDGHATDRVVDKVFK
ncbi:CDP-glycerol glycerophosphotransferase family protein [Bacillus massilinigeriensis]|uniref:CDP-glycerol glycerophosphotransferase family protein n=1 Tax=Bacillus massilionigeriensis TaxID=1805475 RepID=UPI00096B0ECB|nr:CDP-glycerol glycerophosphotransferase family protein [Bacillus massilionigeriensis]